MKISARSFALKKLYGFLFFPNEDRKNIFIPSLIISIVFFTSLAFSYTICFETNDDVLFSMLAHGYGIASYQTTFLPASNSLIASVAQTIPSIATMPGYMILSVILLFSAIWGILYFLLRLGLPVFICLGAFFLIALRAILVPQFTVTTGLLTIASILCLHGYSKKRQKIYLPLMVLLAFSAYLLRSQEFFLVAFISLPLLPWKKFFKDPLLIITGCIFLCLMLFGHWFDVKEKNAPELQEYTTFLETMIPIFNYGASGHLAARDDILQRHGYTTNDMELLRNYFYLTPKLTDTTAINAMLTELGPTYKQTGNIHKALYGLKALRNNQLLPLLCFGGLLLIFLPNWRLRVLTGTSWLFVLGALFAMGLAGRPGIMRVYYPLACLLLIAPLMLYNFNTTNKKFLITTLSLALFVCCIWNAKNILPIAKYNTTVNMALQQQLENIPKGEPIFSWGASFPYEYAYPLFSDYDQIKKDDFPLLGGYTPAPFSSTVTKAKAGVGLLDILQTSGGVLIIERGDVRRKALGIFCQEVLGCTLSYEGIQTLETDTTILRMWCK